MHFLAHVLGKGSQSRNDNNSFIKLLGLDILYDTNFEPFFEFLALVRSGRKNLKIIQISKHSQFLASANGKHHFFPLS